MFLEIEPFIVISAWLYMHLTTLTRLWACLHAALGFKSSALGFRFLKLQKTHPRWLISKPSKSQYHSSTIYAVLCVIDHTLILLLLLMGWHTITAHLWQFLQTEIQHCTPDIIFSTLAKYL